MRGFAFFAAVAALLALPRAMAQSLPDLGGPGDAALAPALERRIGESIVRDIRRDPSYVDDPEVAEYLSTIGAKLTQVASRFQSGVWIARNGRRVNAKSIMGVMMLAAGKGSNIELETDGPDEGDAMQALEGLLADKFGEPE